jgi:hypothetical protein
VKFFTYNEVEIGLGRPVMSRNDRAARVNVQIDGDVSGQIAIGDNILQIGDVNGGIVNIVQPEKKPTFSQRQRPVNVRPRKFPGFLNRITEMDAVVGALNNGEPVSMFAENGMGKTSLLRQLSYHAPGDNFPDGILYFPVHIKNVDDLLQIIFDHFYESDSPAKPTDAVLRQLLQEVEALIILDDVLLTEDEITELLNAVPRSLFVLAAPERCLWGEGHCIELQGLPLQEAITLIQRELQRDLLPSERSSAEALHQLGFGQPLFLIQAAAQVRDGKPFEEIVKAVKESEGGLGESIVENLNETQLSILDLLRTFKDAAIPRKHLEKLVETKSVEAQLKKLNEMHLIKEHGSAVSLAGTLAMPLSLKQAMDLDWEARSLAYFIQWIEKNPSGAEIGDTLDLLLSLVERAVLIENWEAVVKLGRGIEGALILKGFWENWHQVLGWILKAAGSLSDQATKAWALHQLGTRSHCLGDFSAAQEALKQALSIREAIGDQAAAALTRGNLEMLTTVPTPPPTQPGVAPGAGLSPVLKAALVLGGIAATAAGALLWEPPTAPPTLVTQAPVEAPLPPIPTEKPEPTELPEPSPTVEILVAPPPLDCTYDLDFVAAVGLGNGVSISFDAPFDVPNQTMDSARNVNLGDKLIVSVNSSEVADYSAGVYAPD